MAATLSPQLANLVSALNVPKNVEEFLVANDILDTESYALLSATELDLKEDIIDMLKGKGIKLEALKDVIAVKKTVDRLP